jgi:predicted Zn-dependent protease
MPPRESSIAFCARASLWEFCIAIVFSRRAVQTFAIIRTGSNAFESAKSGLFRSYRKLSQTPARPLRVINAN